MNMATEDEVWNDTLEKWLAEVRREKEQAYKSRKAQRRADQERLQAARRSAKTYSNAWRARRGR